MRIFMVLMIVALAAGCTVGPDYIRPKIDVPAAYRFEDKEARDTANTQWWRQFQDPVLDALIIEALSNNKNIRLAAANVEKAAGVLTQTRSSLFPQIDYSGSGTKQRSSEAGRNPRARFGGQPADHVPVARQRQLGDRPLGPHPAISPKRRRPDLLSTEEAKRGVILSLVSSVASDYIQLLGLDMQLDDRQAHACHLCRIGQAL